MVRRRDYDFGNHCNEIYNKIDKKYYTSFVFNDGAVYFPYCIHEDLIPYLEEKKTGLEVVYHITRTYLKSKHPNIEIY